MDAGCMIFIRFAEDGDVHGIKALCDSAVGDVGFYPRGAIARFVQMREVLVAESDGELLGAVFFHHRRDGQTTLYTIVVSSARRRAKVGTHLVQALLNVCRDHTQHTLFLRCPEDSAANEFYRALGFSYVGRENGKRRPLILWQKQVEV